MAKPAFFSRFDLRRLSTLSLLPILLVTADSSASDSGLLHAPHVDQSARETLEGLFPFMGLRFAQQIEFDSIPIRNAAPSAPATPTQSESDGVPMVRDGAMNALTPPDNGHTLALESTGYDNVPPSTPSKFDAEVTELTTDALGIDPEEGAVAIDRPDEVDPIRSRCSPPKPGIGEVGELRIMRCNACGTFLHPPRPVCHQCLSEDITPQAVAGTGVIDTFTVNYQKWTPQTEVPFVIARVALDGAPGVFLTTNIIGASSDDVDIGDRVKVVFEQHDDVYLPLFEKI